MRFEQFQARHLIGGAWQGGDDAVRLNPARKEDAVSTYPIGGVVELEQAVAAAQAAAPGWAATPAPRRGEFLQKTGALLEERSATMARLICREEGKTYREALVEVQRAVAMLRFYGGEANRFGGMHLPSREPRTDVFTVKEPLGVVGLITPWNFPLAIPVWKLAPALAAGNTVVLKPASFVPGVSHVLFECLLGSGLPSGVVNLIHGPGAVLGHGLAEDGRVAAVSFTGSTEVGKSVEGAASARGARVQLELGGKNGVLVLDDADVALTARNVVLSAYGGTGQVCTSTSRLIVERGIKKSLLRALQEEMDSIVVGDGLEARTTMGPVVSPSQLDSNLEHVSGAVGEGAHLMHGGDHSNLYMEPVLLDDVAVGAKIAQEEVFGPVLVVHTVDGFEEGLAAVNNSKFGLVAGIATQHLGLAHEFARRARVGVVKVNRPTSGTDIQVPYGGVKASSNNLFREQGVDAMDFFSSIKAVYLGY